MSADSWEVCPRCHEKYVEECDSFNKKVDDLYGKIPPEEYIRLLAENDRMQSQEEPRTLREDYELGIIEGEYYLRYNGTCTKCGWHYEKSIDEKVYG